MRAQHVGHSAAEVLERAAMFALERVPNAAPRRIASPSDELCDGVHRWSEIRELLNRGEYVRAVNFHATPRCRESDLRRQFANWSERFHTVNYADLMAFIESGEWPHEKPGLLLNFFNGYRDNFDVARPLMREFGLTGWFYVPTGFVDTPPQKKTLKSDWADRPTPSLD